MKYLAKLETGRLGTKLEFEAETFIEAAERVENERVQLDQRTQLRLGATQIISLSTRK